MKSFGSLDDVLKCILSYFFDPKDEHFRERCEQQPSLGIWFSPAPSADDLNPLHVGVAAPKL